ncbi:hypothetical protein Z042_08630 [Chania multitudinisentens RB-25]|uniref:Uncharacterized protein n=1 Tax=Chania multitudinisentens RB-25 TaxID=1441930 RepID=W0LCH9_9GAMM|nr:hypothetical protein [Chania multitudinisentens]AHG19680.1 hypothetical protein Z042_08630 [Chania multitudinisentens RB-25]
MQVGLKTTTGQTRSAMVRGGVNAAQTVNRVATPDVVATRNSFPEAALLSRRPLRYNVQLNQQLTVVQQADDYLAQTETRLLQIRHTFRQENAPEPFIALKKHLDRRTEIAGNAIDRHFTVCLQQKNSVNFTLPGMEKLLSDPGGELLIFALEGKPRELAAVALPDEVSPLQTLMHLNLGLGRFGIHAQQTPGGQLNFSVTESDWDRIRQQLTVCGQGHHFPSDAFTLLVPQAETAASDIIAQLAQGRERGDQAKLQSTLNHITTQRSLLRQQQDRVASRIKDMNTMFSDKQALATSQALGDMLGNCAANYPVLSAALGAQANLKPSTVKNLLQ